MSRYEGGVVRWDLVTDKPVDREDIMDFQKCCLCGRHKVAECAKCGAKDILCWECSCIQKPLCPDCREQGQKEEWIVDEPLTTGQT